jgi:FMN phosphatase YigB (HAD superfamily)
VERVLELKRKCKTNAKQRGKLRGPALPRFTGQLRAVLFDFDATLTALDGLSVDRLFPQRGGNVDVRWLRETGFGGEVRILRLGATLQALAACGAELHIVSLADRTVVVRALAMLGALHFFCNRICGWEELGGMYASKAPFIKSLMEDKKWSRDEVLFIDDQEHNLEDTRGLCLTHHVRGSGLCLEELVELERRAYQIKLKHDTAA